MAHCPVTVGHPFSGWRRLQVGPGRRGLPSVRPEGGSQPCRKLPPAASLGPARSWGHTADAPWWEIFLQKANPRPLWVCSPFRKDPSPPLGISVQAPDSAGRPSLVLPPSPLLCLLRLPFPPAPALPHLLAPLNQSFGSPSRSTEMPAPQ